MYLLKKPPSPKYSLTPFLFLYAVLLISGELFSTSSMDRLHVTLCVALFTMFMWLNPLSTIAVLIESVIMISRRGKKCLIPF